MKRVLLTGLVCVWSSLLSWPVASRAAEESTSVVDVVENSGVQQKPRWEFGVGGGVFFGQDYPASDDPNRRALALPFFIYRSQVFRLGDGGIRAIAIERPRVKLDLSIGGSLNASSHGNRARDGMPDLDFLFELGPRLAVSLFDRPTADGGRWLGRFSVELRAVVSTNFRRFDGQGAVAEAGFGVTRRRLLGSPVSLLASVEATFATEELHDYFYAVDAAYVTPARLAYDARGGYLGTDAFVGLAWQPSSTWRIFAGLSQGIYKGAANEASPLFETTSTTGAAIGFAWTIARSKEMIDIVDLEGQ